jgi:lipopolysaccharide/colanic/teichoic acid biosynthesis glycosyltransferase
MRPFTQYKFRTMRGDCAARGIPLPDSARISPVGRVLRRTRLDGLPQLFNVLRGDMSFIGPQPLLPHDLPDGAAGRVALRPGITGWAQVNGRDAIPWERRFELDVWYIEHWSLALDARIVLMTLVQLFGPRPEPVRDDLNIERAKRRG